MRRIQMVGIGNTLAGDDGVGIYIVENLESRLKGIAGLSFACLRHDLFEISDHLDKSDHFVFFDAALGTTAGITDKTANGTPLIMPSLHQTDISTTMTMLATLSLVNPFPTWELWTITVVPPLILEEGLSEAVRDAAEKLIGELCLTFQNR